MVLRVEELARNGRGVSGKGILQRPRVPIDTIAHDRQARMGQVHPDLVGATTPGEGGDEGEATEALPALEVGGGFPAALSRHPEPIWIPGGRLDRSLDPLRIEPRLVMTDGQVLLLHLPASELGLEMLESLQGAAEGVASMSFWMSLLSTPIFVRPPLRAMAPGGPTSLACLLYTSDAADE